MQRNGMHSDHSPVLRVILGPVLFILVAVFLTLAYIVAVLLTCLYVPRLIVVRRLYWWVQQIALAQHVLLGL